MVDEAKIRREALRWNILLTLNNARPIGAYEELVLATMQAILPDATAMELRRELDYLAARHLLTLVKEPSGRWFADLNRYGVDVAEYTVECEPGIGRPNKYWGN
jgi:hypothetical protein